MSEGDGCDDIYALLKSAKISVAKLRVIGIDKRSITEELLFAHKALMKNDYENAYIYASRVLKEANSLKSLYRDTCIAMASAADLITDVKKKQGDVTKPLNMLRDAKKSFEKTQLEKAYECAVSSCREILKYPEMNVMVEPAGESIPCTNDAKQPVRICEWQLRVDGMNCTVCINLLGANYKQPCAGRGICRIRKNIRE
jgi:hypothetical protein